MAKISRKQKPSAAESYLNSSEAPFGSARFVIAYVSAATNAQHADEKRSKDYLHSQ